MNYSERTDYMPEVINLFLEPRLQAGNFISNLLHSLNNEKAANFGNVNRYLENLVGDGNRIAEELHDFQSYLEQAKFIDKNLEAAYDSVHTRTEDSLHDLHFAKQKLDELKIMLCRFITSYESPSKRSLHSVHTVEQWMDAATLAEMRLARQIQPDGDRSSQKFLALFMTFRSIVCSYEGPSFSIRQLESALASLDSIYEKVELELEVYQTSQRLVATRKELSTVKLDLTAMQSHINHAEKLKKLKALEERGGFMKILLLIAFFLAGGGGLAFYFYSQSKVEERKRASVISQNSCKEIHDNLRKSARYKEQILVFRKFETTIPFAANPLTCQKLHSLDSTQIVALAALIKEDFERGKQAEPNRPPYPVLNVKDIGIHKLAVTLQNSTEDDMNFKLKVLEQATRMRGALYAARGSSKQDLLIVDLTLKTVRPDYN